MRLFSTILLYILTLQDQNLYCSFRENPEKPIFSPVFVIFRRTGLNFDVRFFFAAPYRSPLSSCNFLSKSLEPFFLNLNFHRFSQIFRRLGFFSENPAVSLLSLYQCLTSCKESERSLEPFLRKTINQLIIIIIITRAIL